MEETDKKELERVRETLGSVIGGRLLRAAVLGRPSDKSALRARAELFEADGGLYVRLETFLRDGKALHENIPADAAAERVTELLASDYGQLDILTSAGNCVVLRSKSGRVHMAGKIEAGGTEGQTADDREVGGHDREKRHILRGDEEFLKKLGISDSDGRVIDRRRAKFRQINRFLELLRDVLPALPEDELTVCDFCCGKSYLTFAVYHYLTEILGRRARMYGVDLKRDMMELCSKIAAELGYAGLSFECADITGWEPPSPPQLVISLHACDTATDVALAKAVKSGARAILSTPCCHHELNHMLERSGGAEELRFITRHSILRQKLCDAATDALRALRLEAEGYAVEAVELIDPDETPKNVMLRCVLRSGARPADELERTRASYRAARKTIGLDGPTALDRLLGETGESAETTSTGDGKCS